MAWNSNSECDLSDASNFYVTSTPNVPYPLAENIDDKYVSYRGDDSGYFTQLKPALTRQSLAEQCVDFPSLNLEISDAECGHIDNDLNSCSVISDSGIVCRSENVNKTERKCWLRLHDVPSICSPPDTVDQLCTIARNVPEDSSFTHYLSWGSVHQHHPVTIQQPPQVSHVDFIHHLCHIPHVLSVILCHVSDADLCRMSCVSRSWQNAICNDRVSHERRLHYLEVYAQNKENSAVKACSVARTMTLASQPLCSVQRTNSRSSKVYTSAVADDISLQRCKRYWEIGSTLPAGEHLTKCPRCQSPVRTMKHRALCTSPECSYDICVNCQHSYHGTAACRPTPPRTSAGIGSRVSKKRLHRLCR